MRGGDGGVPTVSAPEQISCSKTFFNVLQRAGEQSVGRYDGARPTIRGGVGNVGCHDSRRTASSCFYSDTSAVVFLSSTTAHREVYLSVEHIQLVKKKRGSIVGRDSC